MSTHKLEHCIISKLNIIKESKAGTMFDESFSYKSIFLNLITPDETNPRFLPIIVVDDHDSKLFVSRKITKNQLVKMYDAEGNILLGKSFIINCFKYESSDWKKAIKVIESIIELGNNIKMSELIQVATIYPISPSKFQILTGHRRYFSLVYVKGYSAAAQFKVYNSKPLLLKIKQFQENASREDLPQFGKLMAFKDAMSEIERLNDAKLKLGEKKLTVKERATSLGISMGTFDNYSVLSRYKCVINSYKYGLSFPFIKTKGIVLNVETEYKEKHKKSALNITDRKIINDEIESILLGNKNIKSQSLNHSYRIKKISSSQTIKSLLVHNVMELNTGVDWEAINWDDRNSVQQVIETVIGYLESMNS